MFYVGINGTMRDVVNGENQNLNPKVFFLSKVLSANVTRRVRAPSNPEIYVGALQHFLEALEKCVAQ